MTSANATLTFSQGPDKEWGAGAIRYDIHQGSRNVASAVVRPNPRKELGGMTLSDLLVRKEHRGEGLGRQLLQHVTSEHEGLFLRPRPYKDRPLAEDKLRSFYASEGFQPHGKELMQHTGKKKEADAEHKLQGHTRHQGLGIAIENRKGSVRSGVDKDGKPWRTEMKHPYGYLKNSRGADGEEVDCYVGPKKDATHAYVVHQKDDAGNYDEDKAILGVGSRAEAKRLYLQHYNHDKYLGPIKRVPMERFKELISSGKKLTKISSVTLDALCSELKAIVGART